MVAPCSPLKRRYTHLKSDTTLNKLSLFPWHEQTTYTWAKIKCMYLKWEAKKIHANRYTTTTDIILNNLWKLGRFSFGTLLLLSTNERRTARNNQVCLVLVHSVYVYYIWQMSIIRLFYDPEIIFLFSRCRYRREWCHATPWYHTKLSNLRNGHENKDKLHAIVYESCSVVDFTTIYLCATILCKWD